MLLFVSTISSFLPASMYVDVVLSGVKLLQALGLSPEWERSQLSCIQGMILEEASNYMGAAAGTLSVIRNPSMTSPQVASEFPEAQVCLPVVN